MKILEFTKEYGSTGSSNGEKEVIGTETFCTCIFVAKIALCKRVIAQKMTIIAEEAVHTDQCLEYINKVLRRRVGNLTRALQL